MTEIAELRMDVESGPVTRGVKELDKLTAASDRAEKATQKLGGQSRGAAAGIGDYARRAKEGEQSTMGLGRSMERLRLGALGVAAGFTAVVSALSGLAVGLNAANEFRNLSNALKLVTDSQEELLDLQGRLIDVSLGTFSSVSATVEGYQRMAAATQRLNLDQGRLLKVTETVNKAIQLSGATATGASITIQQFGQALSSDFKGVAQEFNTINDQAFFLGETLAKGLTKVTGVETFRGDLKRLAQEGKLNSELIVAALEAMGEDVDEVFGDLDRTVDQVTQNISTRVKVLAATAFKPLSDLQISAFSKIEEALSSPGALKAAENLRDAITDIASAASGTASFLVENWSTIQGAIEGAAAAAITFAGISLVTSIVATGRLAAAWIGVRDAIVAAQVAGAGGVFATIGRAVAGLASRLGVVRFAVTAIGLAWNTLVGVIVANPITATIAAIVAAVVLFRDEIANALVGVDDAGLAIQATFNVIKANVEGVTKSIVGGLSGAFDKVKGAAKDFFDKNLSEPLVKFLMLSAQVGAFVRNLIPDSAIEQARKLLARIAEIIAQLPGLREARELRNDIQQEARRITFEDERKNFAEKFGTNTPIGLFNDPSIKEAQNAFRDLNKEAGEYLKVAKEVGKTKIVPAETLSELRKALGFAERLAAAAERGGIAFEAEKASQERTKRIESAVESALSKAKEAGEKLDEATARTIITRTDDMLEAAKALREADKVLREQAANRAKSLAETARNTVQNLLGRAGDVDLSGLSLSSIQRAGASIQDAIDEARDFLNSDATIGVSPDALEELAKTIDEASATHGKRIKDAINDGAKNFQRAVQSVFGTFIDDLFFNGGRGLGDLFRSAVREIGSKILTDPISRALSGDGDIFGNIEGAFKSLTDNFAKAGSSVTGAIDKSLASIGSTLGAALGAAGAAFAVGSGIAELLGIQKGTVPFAAIFGGVPALLTALLTNKTAFQSVELATGDTVRAQKSRNDKRNDVVAQAIGVVVPTVEQLADLIGASIAPGIAIGISENGDRIRAFVEDATRPGTILAVGQDRASGDVEAAVRDALNFAITRAFNGGNQALKDFATEAINSGQSLEEVVEVLGALSQASERGSQALSEYALVAARAGRSGNQITEGVNRLAQVYALTEQPLSEVAAALKNIDDVINPVISDLMSLGQSIAEISKIGQDAARALGENFIQGIRDLNISLQNTTFGQFNELLKQIREREEEARLLFERGAISSQQLGFVQSTSGLEVSKFFEGLGDDDKESLAGFLGLLRTASGDVAVERVRLKERFDFLIENVDETARAFEDAAQTFTRLSQSLRDTAEQIRVEFSGLTPRDQTVNLQGRVANLLAQARDDSASTESRQSALTALPQVVTQLVQSARQAFGGTEQFASIRDFGLSALDSAATLSERLAAFNAQQAENVRRDEQTLEEIKELLADDRQLPTLQGILNEGKLTNQLIAQQLQAFVNLVNSAGSNLNTITAEELQQAALDFLSRQQAAIAQQTPAPSGPSASAQSTTAPVGQTATQAQFAQALLEQATATSRNTAAVARMENELNLLTGELRRSVVRQNT